MAVRENHYKSHLTTTATRLICIRYAAYVFMHVPVCIQDMLSVLLVRFPVCFLSVSCLFSCLFSPWPAVRWVCRVVREVCPAVREVCDGQASQLDRNRKQCRLQAWLRDCTSVLVSKPVFASPPPHTHTHTHTHSRLRARPPSPALLRRAR